MGKKNDVDDLIGTPTKKTAKKVKAALPAPKGKNKATAKTGRKPKLADDAKLKGGKTEPREGSMFAIVRAAFGGAGATLETGMGRLRKTLKQPRGTSAKSNPDTFIRGYIRGALAAGVLATA